MEKKYRTNIEISLKRTLKSFKETSILFIKENCYYLCQKYIIKEILWILSELRKFRFLLLQCVGK